MYPFVQCLLIVLGLTLVHAADVGQQSVNRGVVDVIMRDGIAGLAPVAFDPQNGLASIVQHLVSNVTVDKKLHRASVPELDVPQVVRLMALIGNASSPVLTTLQGVRTLLEVLIGPSWPVMELDLLKQASPNSTYETLTAYYLATGFPRAFPVARRCFMAWAVQRHLAGHEWSPEEVELLLRIARYFHRLHRSAAEAKHVLEFFHISKTGGSSLCQIGAANGCATQNSSVRGNCLIRKFQDFPRWSRADALSGLARLPWWCAHYGRRRGEISCTQRRKMLSRNRWNFYANEYVMQTTSASESPDSYRRARPCTDFLYVMVFRNPEHRMLSNLQNVLREYTWTPPPPSAPVIVESWPPPAAPGAAVLPATAAGIIAEAATASGNTTGSAVAAVHADSAAAAAVVTPATVVPTSGAVQTQVAAVTPPHTAAVLPTASGAVHTSIGTAAQDVGAVQQAPGTATTSTGVGGAISDTAGGTNIAAAAVQPAAMAAAGSSTGISAGQQHSGATAEPGGTPAVATLPAAAAVAQLTAAEASGQGGVMPSVNGQLPTVGGTGDLQHGAAVVAAQPTATAAAAVAARRLLQAATASVDTQAWERSVSDVFFTKFDPLNTTAWQSLAPAVVDNYFLRSLLGETTYMAPLHSLTAVHLAVGKLVTLQLDILLTLELPSLNAASFQMGLGWSSGFQHVHARHGQVIRTLWQGPSTETLREAMAPLREDNRLDREVYEFAAVAQLMDALAWNLAKAALSDEALKHLAARRKHKQCGFIGPAKNFRQLLRLERRDAVARLTLLRQTGGTAG